MAVDLVAAASTAAKVFAAVDFQAPEVSAVAAFVAIVFADSAVPGVGADADGVADGADGDLDSLRGGDSTAIHTTDTRTATHTIPTTLARIMDTPITTTHKDHLHRSDKFPLT